MSMKKAYLVIIAIAGLAAAIPLVAGPKIVGGPFVVGVTQRTATMVWIVQSDEVTLRSAAGTATLTSPSLRVEKTTFTGLQPNTRYEYAIPDAGDPGTGSFKTPPPAGPTPYRFVVYGDTRTRHDVHQRVIGELMKHGIPDFILHGDNPHMTALVPMFEKYHVSAAFFGHDHNYQHYLKNGVQYVTTGGGGAPLYDVDIPSAEITQKVASVENFVTVSVNREIAKIKAIAIDGRTLEEFDIKSSK